MDICYVRFKINKVDFETSLTSLGLQFKINNYYSLCEFIAHYPFYLIKKN